ncbi:metal/formaldehyde-sensitive transcriptional repressor [Salinimonas sediminis]|uniref:Metal/formaldehyde-sensitive transcriptional repressor n=1 Tax=Salinimonas sediminis TaxID=2303538 RepID=A0A346NJ52_9ALTE|nr:metal/formaldehyde-sensitive transcriptional repressor [Salinimonas sediminis]AXR05559.1 metal/formaldehyde-sensitive transcriptional repressor [Salinimonas sediminis]
MAHLIAHKAALQTRVRKIQGQAGALDKLLEQNTDCLKVLQQVAAIKGAVNGLMKQVLEDHIREHIGSRTLTHEERDTEVDALITILNSYLK